MIIDTHIHLDDERYNNDIEDVLDRARQKGVKRFIIPGADPKTLPRAQALAQRFDDVFFSVGVHPYDCDNYDESFLEPFLKDEKCVSVGECGLDYFRLPEDEKEKEAVILQQKKVFKAQIELAIKVKKPLIVHVREASVDAKKMLLEYGSHEVGGVLHCYNANQELLSLANENFYFGIGGVLTFKNAKKLVEVLPMIAKDKLIIETDGPYLTPHPHRGKRNEPMYTTLVAKKMEELLDISYEEIANLTTKNAQKLFSLR